jgi:ABC-type amino acid transport substrate-binding protein
MDPIILTIIGVIVTVLIGVPALYYQRRQTRLAEIAHVAAQLPPVNRIDVMARIRAEKRVRIGVVHYPPFATMLSDEEPSGLYVELLRELCATEGIDPIFKQVRFSSAVDCVRDDQLDAVLSVFQTPRRSRIVDFCAFMHTVSVSGIVRRTEDRITSQSDLLQLRLAFVVCRDEIGHELLQDALRVPLERLMIIETSNIADIAEMVAAKKADIAIADSLSCCHALAARGAEGPKLKPVLRRRPLYHCFNGVMIARNQDPLADWLEKQLKTLLARDDFRKKENAILEEYHAIISKV